MRGERPPERKQTADDAPSQRGASQITFSEYISAKQRRWQACPRSLQLRADLCDVSTACRPFLTIRQPGSGQQVYVSRTRWCPASLTWAANAKAGRVAQRSSASNPADDFLLAMRVMVDSDDDDIDDKRKRAPTIIRYLSRLVAIPCTSALRWAGKSGPVEAFPPSAASARTPLVEAPTEIACGQAEVDASLDSSGDRCQEPQLTAAASVADAQRSKGSSQGGLRRMSEFEEHSI